MMATWKPPQLLTGLDIPPIAVKSNEMKIQPNRMSTTPAVRYSSENEVPDSPTLLSEFEKASDLSSRNSSAPQNIPFFTPSAGSVSPSAGTAYNGNVSNNFAQTFPPPVQPNMNPPSEATLETVLMMGLPLFLVGSNLQALQTLVSNPGLLASFKDMNGVYKQPELINLVQTLTQNLVPQASQPNLMPGYTVPNPMYNAVANQMHTAAVTPGHTAATTPMHTAATVPTHAAVAAPVNNSFAQPQPTQQQGSRGGYRGDQNDGEANLHLSGYGPTTSNADIIGTRLLVQTCFLLSYLACINLHNLPCKSVVFTIRSCR